MTIYIDIVLMENFILNYIILLSTAMISKSKQSILRFSLSSLIGALFSFLGYIIKLNIYIEIVLKILISIIMVKIAFNNIKITKLITNLSQFYLISLFYGGCAFFIMFLLENREIYTKNQLFDTSYPLKVILLGITFGFILICIVRIMAYIKEYNRAKILDLEIFYNGKNLKVKTLLDSGNLLKEPISQRDVIIIEKEELYGFVSNEILNNITNILEGKWLSDNSKFYNFKLIPFSSLGRENGLLIGFKPDYIKVYADEEYLKNEVFIGIYDGKLTNNNLYTSLIGLNILNEEESIK